MLLIINKIYHNYYIFIENETSSAPIFYGIQRNFVEYRFPSAIHNLYGIII